MAAYKWTMVRFLLADFSCILIFGCKGAGKYIPFAHTDEDMEEQLERDYKRYTQEKKKKQKQQEQVTDWTI
jgi:hypothetical protein